MNKKTVEDLKKLAGKVVFTRVDFNVPIKDNEVTDTTRIKAALPTISYLVKNNARVVLLSHLGRVKTLEDKKKLSLLPVANEINNLAKFNVKFIPFTTGEEVEKAIKNMKDGSVIMLENTRFEDLDKNGKIINLESKNDEKLGAYWASLTDYFVNDSFGTAHRAHASNVGIATKVEQNAIGYLIKKEVEFLQQAIDDPKRPFVVLLGGAKISDKIKVIESLLIKADKVIIGTAMCYTFLLAKGKNIGNSLSEPSQVKLAKKLLETYADKLVIAEDFVYAPEFKDIKGEIGSEIPSNMIGMDVGPKTIQITKDILKDAKTILWNGPFGVSEFSNFENGTKEIANAIVKVKGAITIIGGGDSAAAVVKFGLEDKFSHVSTGGGASMQLVEGNDLPGISSINDRRPKPNFDLRKPIIIGNWKMNNGPIDTIKFVKEFNKKIKWSKSIILPEIVIAAPFISIPYLLPFKKGSNKHLIGIAAQDVDTMESGARTGQISAQMLMQNRVKYVIIGHSERRSMFGDTDEIVNAKVKIAFKNGLIPVLAFGETEKEYNNKLTKQVIERQLTKGLKDLPAFDVAKIIIAYEPIWAIGTGKTASAAQAQEMTAFARSIIEKLYDNKVSQKTRIQYGGSVNAENIDEIMLQDDIDGALVGGASVKADSFVKLVTYLK